MNQSRLAGYTAVLGAIVLTLSASCGGGDSPSGSGGAATSATGTTATGAGGAASTGAEATSSTGAGGSGNLGALDLVITEIMNNPGVASDDAGEWLEIHNATTQTIDLAGLVLESGSVSHVIASSVKVAPDGYAVLGVNAMTDTNGGVPVDYQYSLIKLPNTKGTLTIRTVGMLVIDTLTYDAASGLDPDGQSRSLDPEFLSASMNDTDAHWCAGTSFINGTKGDRGTPGKANDACP